MKAKVIGAMVLLAMVSAAMADNFGTGTNQFTIDFVTISGSTNPTSGIPAGDDYVFTGVNNDYRMGVYEITNDQWTKFRAAYGTVTGSPPSGYNSNPFYTGASVPANNVSWYEAAQFVNWLNTSTGHQAAYKFNGTRGTGDYAFAVWSPAEADNGTNLYRHKDAIYYLPTEDEWVKAGYWNGTSLQTYATKAGESLTQGDGTSGTGWNYRDNGFATYPLGPWNVGSGSKELNDTYDMMGNVSEWTETPQSGTSYEAGSSRWLRGETYAGTDTDLASSDRDGGAYPDLEGIGLGFRVASEVPEPATLSLLALGGMALRRRRKK